MRDFEEDFGFDSDYFGNAAKTVSTRGCRLDSYKAVTFDPNGHLDPKRQARIVEHQQRVQREMQELGILYERNYV